MNELRLVKGNTFSTLVKVRAYAYDGTEIEDFELQDCTDVKVVAHVGEARIYNRDFELQGDNFLRLTWVGTKLGEYQLEVTGIYEEKRWRFYDKKPIFTIVNTNVEANIPEHSILEPGYYFIEDYYVRLDSSNNYPGPVIDNLISTSTTSALSANMGRVLNEKKQEVLVAGENMDTEPTEGSTRPISSNAVWYALNNPQGCSRIHTGEYNANSITDEGWYDSIVLGRPERSESDEKYFLYMSSNGGQVCFSRRNSGKAFERLGLEHPWVPITRDDYSLLNALNSALTDFSFSEKISAQDFASSPATYDSSTNLTEVYAGDNLTVTSFDMNTQIHVEPGSIIKVRAFYRRGFSLEGCSTYQWDSDAYIYLNDQITPDHSSAHLYSDFIKVTSMWSTGYPFTEQEKGWQSLGFARNNIFTSTSEYGWHYIKCNNKVPMDLFLHVTGDFSKPGSWIVVDSAEVYSPAEWSNCPALEVWNVGYMDAPNFTAYPWNSLLSLIIEENTTLLIRANLSANEYYFNLTGRVSQGSTLLEATFATHRTDGTYTTYILTNSGGVIQCSISTIGNTSYTKNEVDTLLLGKMDNITIDSAPTASSLHLVYSGGVKTYVDTSISTAIGNIDLSNYYTKGQTDSMLNAKQAKLVVGTNLDNVPSPSSTNPITSGGVYTALQGNIAAPMLIETKNAATTSTINAQLETYYNISGSVESLSIILPDCSNVGDGGRVSGCIFYFKTGTVASFNISCVNSQSPIVEYDGYEIIDDTTYELNCVWNGSAWVIAYGIVVA